RITDKELTTSNGISLLEVKYHTLLQYITNLVYLVGLKLDGAQLEGHPVIDSLIRGRVVLEKIKPVEQKLKYQIDKLIRAASVGTEAAASADGTDAWTPANPYSFRPNPQQLAGDKKDQDEESDDENKLYRAPRLAPVHYDEGDDAKEKRKKHEQRMLEKAAKSRLIRDLVAEYDDRPEEQGVEGGARDGYGGDDALDIREKERTRYEEDNFTRLTLSKKEARRARDGGMNRFTDEFKVRCCSILASATPTDVENLAVWLSRRISTTFPIWLVFKQKMRSRSASTTCWVARSGDARSVTS
ncbi:hypothetical protein THASP1DRAFT_11937, partial [Thamnocephalis sphaerospora]